MVNQQQDPATKFEPRSPDERTVRNMSSMAKRGPRSARSKRRRGVMTIELLLVLPILLFVLMAVFEFSILFFARSSVVQACRTAARQAAMGSADVAPPMFTNTDWISTPFLTAISVSLPSE